jgi:serine/threonine-protein kinase
MDVAATLRHGLAGRYRLVREIGVGGMATVYLADDLRHARQVALKVLKPELGAVLGVERFLAEIRVTANLQHPHLLPLFDSGEVAGLLFYVMPFVAGESLRQRLEREQQLSIAESVRIGAAVASALDYAHRNNVVHRDLKPENILLQDGEPVISDFGIALAVSRAGGARITQTGLSLGTPAYMSPEQAAGDRVVDARSDVYSLGAVVYEMLIGEPPHTGANVQQIISRVLTEHPRGISEQRPTVPRPLNDAVLRALAKLPADRYDSAREFGEALKSGATPGGGYPTAALPIARRSWSRWIPWGVAAATTVVAAAQWLTRDPAPGAPPVVRFSVAPPGGLRNGTAELAISANGRRLLVAEGPPGSRRVWLRSFDDDDLQELTSLAGAQSPFLSPDGRQVGFVSEGRLRTMLISTGAVNAIASVADGPFGDTPTWGSQGLIVYSAGRADGLWSVPAGGGTPAKVTTPPDGAFDGSPAFLPDGSHFLFERRAAPTGEAALMLGDLAGTVVPLGGLRGSAPRYLDGYLSWLTGDGEVRVVPLGRNWQPAGEPRTLLSLGTGNGGPRGPRGPPYVASASGVMAFVEATRQLADLVWVDRSGRTQTLSSSPRSFSAPAVAPAGNRVAVEVTAADGSSDIYTYDASGASQRVTRAGRNQSPAWNAAGNLLAWSTSAAEGGTWRLVVQRVDVPDSARVVVSGPGMIRAHSFSPNGDSIRVVRLAPRSTPELLAIDIATGGTSRYHSEAGERSASVSPDGSLVTYVASENNSSHVFVRPSRAPGPVLQLSDAGGEGPRWGTDGRTVFFRDSASMVEVKLSADAIPRVLSRTSLFPDTFERAGFTNFGHAANRFLLLKSVGEGAHIDVIVNAPSLIRGRALPTPNQPRD